MGATHLSGSFLKYAPRIHHSGGIEVRPYSKVEREEERSSLARTAFWGWDGQIKSPNLVKGSIYSGHKSGNFLLSFARTSMNFMHSDWGANIV